MMASQWVAMRRDGGWFVFEEGRSAYVPVKEYCALAVFYCLATDSFA